MSTTRGRGQDTAWFFNADGFCFSPWSMYQTRAFRIVVLCAGGGPGQRHAEDQPGFGGDDKKGWVDIGAIAWSFFCIAVLLPVFRVGTVAHMRFHLLAISCEPSQDDELVFPKSTVKVTSKRRPANQALGLDLTAQEANAMAKPRHLRSLGMVRGTLFACDARTTSMGTRTHTHTNHST